PDLLAAAPLRPRDVVRAKLEAALLPVALALAVPLAVAFYADAWLGFSALACSFGSASSCALLNLLCPSPGKRKDFMQRHKISVGTGLTEVALAAGWALAAYLMLQHSIWALLPAAILLPLPLVAGRYEARRQRAKS